MEDVLAVYMRPHDPDRPLVCLDESSKQLIAETRVPIPMKRGRPARFDYEYERNGTANLFMMFAPLDGWRHVKVTDRHTAVDYAHVLKDLADTHFANARTIVLVQDNLNIHSKASLYEAFSAAEARRLVERFEWHYTPKHGSWGSIPDPLAGVAEIEQIVQWAAAITLLHGGKLQVVREVQFPGGDRLIDIAADRVNLARPRINMRDHLAMRAPDRAHAGAAVELGPDALAYRLVAGVGKRGLAMLADQIAYARRPRSP
jgi:DDE superfamily endonuclease